MTDLSRLAEAVEFLESVWMVPEGREEHYRQLYDAARSILAAQTIWWCTAHGDWSATFLGEGERCRWSLKVVGSKPCHITPMLLAPPPVEAP